MIIFPHILSVRNRIFCGYMYSYHQRAWYWLWRFWRFTPWFSFSLMAECSDHHYISVLEWHKMHKKILFFKDNSICKQSKLQRLERLRSEDTPRRLMITHSIESHSIKSKEAKVQVTNLKNSPKFQIFELWNKHYTRHTFWSCLIRCANMKWIRQILLKIQSGHDSVHRRTDGWTNRQTRWNQYTPLSTSLKRGV